MIFEYTIPRMGKRVDTVVLYRNIVFPLEFKCGDAEYRSSTYDQVYDYALDLRNFQKESHDKLLVPIMVSTRAPAVQNRIVEQDRIIKPFLAVPSVSYRRRTIHHFCVLLNPLCAKAESERFST